MLTQNEVRKLFHYNPENGNFTRLVTRCSRAMVGMVAGTKKPNEHIYINIKGKLYAAHRLAFLYMEGYFPENDVDHINRKRDDNRWSNLRHVSRACNTQNRGKQKNNTSGVTGIYGNGNNWRAEIKVNKKQIYLGTYKTILEAANARWKAEIKYGFTNCNSTSSALEYIKGNT